MKRPPFIVFEGIDGSGKSTQVRLLAEKLTGLGHAVHTAFQPTNYRIGKLLRDILTGKDQADEETIAALFVADRLDHVHHPDYGLLAQLNGGSVVICDRYYHSSYAYHSQFMDMDWVIQANSLAARALRPDLVLFLDLSPEESMARIRANRSGFDHYEKQETLEKVYANYEESFRRTAHSEHIVRVDARQTPEAMAVQIFDLVRPFLEQMGPA